MITPTKIEQAITALQTHRITLGNSVVQTALNALRQQLQATQVQFIAAERKQVTVMFADISGFTAMSEKLDPEDVRSLINACFERLGAVIKRYDGHIDKFIGDEIMALFGAPAAHENDPERALRAALDMMAALQDFNAEHVDRLPHPLSLHFGINTGLVIAGGIGTAERQDYSVMGDAVNLASRLEGLSETGEILVGQSTFRFALPFFEFKRLEPVPIKGKAKPVKVYRLLKAKIMPEGQVRGVEGLSSPLVGRTGELTQLQQALSRLQGGRGGLISLVGEAGLGKTRLFTELRAAAPNAGIEWAVGRGLSYGKNAGYLVARKIFCNLLDIPPEASPAGASQILREKLHQLFPDRFLDVCPYLAHLMDVPLDEETALRVKHLAGDNLHRRVLQSAEDYITAISKKAPLVMVFDDLHWADPSSLELIQTLAALTQRIPLLILLLYRPRPQSRVQGFQAQLDQLMGSNHTIIQLAPLNDQESSELIDNLLPDCDQLTKIRYLIVNKAEGNPFYVEEVIRSLIDDGILSRSDGEQGWAVNANIDHIAIPDTLQGVIMTRVDRLEPRLKRILQVAAVIGRNFSHQLLAQIVDTHLLQQLEALDLIVLKKKLPDLEYAFKHIFTQESVYKSLLRAKRRKLHQQIGIALESQAGNNPDDSALLLAHHFSQSGDQEKAVKYLTIAAGQAAVAYANLEARELYSQALALLDQNEYERRWQLLYCREQIVGHLAEREQQANNLVLLQTLAELLDDDEKLALTHNRRANYFDRISEYQSSAEAAQLGARKARQADSPHLEAQSLNLLAQSAWRRFDYTAVQKWAGQALQALQIVGDPPERITSLLHLGRASYRLGQYDAALSYIQAAMELAAFTGNKDGEAGCNLILGWIYQRLGKYDAASKHFKRKLEIRRGIGDRYGEANALSHLGWVCHDQEQYRQGLAYCQQAIAISRQIGDRENEAYALTAMGLVVEGMSDIKKARDLYQQALAIHQTINAQTLAMFDRARLAKLFFDEGALTLAYQNVQSVISWASEYGAEQFWDPWLIYHTAYQILQANDKIEEAQAILEEAYTLLQTRANRISDSELRIGFLQNVKVNRLIAEAWENEQAG